MGRWSRYSEEWEKQHSYFQKQQAIIDWEKQAEEFKRKPAFERFLIELRKDTEYYASLFLIHVRAFFDMKRIAA